MKTNIISRAEQVTAKTYNRFPITIVRGEGCCLWDDRGRRYTDFVAGIAVCNLGHCHPKIIKALTDQARKLFHVSNLYYTVPQVELASLLVENSFADKVFFCNSGAEANEAAVKLVRKYFVHKGNRQKKTVIAFEKSFHGRTMATLSATGQDKIKKGYEPVLDGFEFLSVNDPAALEATIGPSTSAVILEPIQGEGGVRVFDKEYLKTLRRLCDQTDTLLVFDEIQTGMGRTGKLFAYEHMGVEPDIMTLAKALGNGLPIGAMAAKDSVAQAFDHGSHASTFGGTPLVTAVACEVLKVMFEENLVDHCKQAGDYFKQKLLQLKEKHPVVSRVHGMGLLLGMTLKKSGAPFVTACMEEGFLINCIQDKVLRFIPPLIIDRDEIDALIDCLDRLFEADSSDPVGAESDQTI